MERINHSELSNLEAISRAVTSENSLGLLKVFIDRNRLMRHGLSPHSIQVRLIEGEGVPWLSALLNPVCVGIRLYVDFPLSQPLNDASLKAHLKMFGVYQRDVSGGWGIEGFSLANIPDGGVDIIDTTDMRNEPLLEQGVAITVTNRTGVSGVIVRGF